MCCKALASNTDSLLRAFWEIEEPPASNFLSSEDEQALTHFQETVSREEDGRYQVRLPRKKVDYKLGNSFRQAMQRYQSNRRSLTYKGQWSEFAEAVKEYGNLGHAELVPELDLQKPDCDAFYLPMHGVVKPSSTTTKLRVVFDGSARTSSGHSITLC